MKIKFFRRRVDSEVTTQAVIYDDSGMVLADSTVRLNPKDRDDRRVARKVSLTRALRAVPDKNTRSAVWDAFWGEYGK